MKEKISNYFIELLNVLEIKTLPKYPNWFLYVYEDKLYMRYDKEYKIAFLSDEKIWSVFRSKYINDYNKIQEITKTLLKKHLKLKLDDITYFYNWDFINKLEERLKLIKPHKKNLFFFLDIKEIILTFVLLIELLTFY